MKEKRKQTIGEEIANSISHGIGAGLSVAGLVIIIVISALMGKTTIEMVSAVIFGGSLTILYLFSTMYHSLTNPMAKKVFQVFDHCSILILILGSYTPIFLVVIKGAIGWMMFGVSVFCTVLGIIMNALNLEKWDKVMQALYIIMGWQAVIIIKPLYFALTTLEFTYLVAGGICYTIGIIFYRNKKVKFMHFIWHLFVIVGSALHYFMILSFYMR